MVCPQCGQSVSDDQTFCGHCGVRLSTDDARPESQTARAQGSRVAEVAHSQAVAGQGGRRRRDGRAHAGPPHPGALVWSYNVPMLANRFMLRDSLLVIVLSVLGLNVVVTVMSFIFNDGEYLFLPWQFSALMAGILAFLILLTFVVVFWNGFNMRFTVDEDGATMESGPRERRINRITTIIGFLALLSGRPGPLGASLLAQSRETTRIQWQDVYRVVVYPGQRVIALSNSWRTVMRLYCSPDNFATMAEQVRAYAAAGERWRAEHPRRKRPLNLFPVKWLAATAIATFAATAWGDDTGGLAVVAGALVFLAGLFDAPLRHLFGLLGVGVTAFLGVDVALSALEKTEIPPITIYGYQTDTTLLYVAAAGILLLLVLGLLRLLGRSGRPVEQPPGRPARD